MVMRVMEDNMRRLAEKSGANCSVCIEGTNLAVQAASLEDFEKLAIGSGPYSANAAQMEQSSSLECIKNFPRALTEDQVCQLGNVLSEYASGACIECFIEATGNDLTVRANNASDFTRLMHVMNVAIMPAVQNLLDHLEAPHQDFDRDFLQPGSSLDH